MLFLLPLLSKYQEMANKALEICRDMRSAG